MRMPSLVINLRDSRPIWSVPDWVIEAISKAAPDRLAPVVVDAPADGKGDGGPAVPEAIEAVAGAEIYLGFGFPKPLFEAAARSGANLQWVHSASAGVGGTLYPEMRQSQLILTNSAGIHAEPMADSALAMILYFARGFDFAVQAQHQARWDKDRFDATDSPLVELEGSTLGVLGYGGIGRAIGRRATALGMRVLALRRRLGDTDPSVTPLTGRAGLDRLLAESQFIVLSLPRTTATEGLLGREQIASLRPDAVVINVGRGELIDEVALAEALAQGRIRGAGLDVFMREPLPPKSPLWRLPNVLITPHASATSHRFWQRELDLILENLDRYQRGAKQLNVVDKGAGY
ncbi:MAG: D-2-hydroxyacid dehydrogenase [Gemmatimonas sp.]|nr:D-2-hydroxyacid dehydrogenase [Gemmatimonas sp.]